MRASGVLWLVTSASMFAACGGTNLASHVGGAPAWQQGKVSCDDGAKEHATPLVVEWTASDRAKLEALAQGGVIAVHYRRCEMRVLPACKVKAAYRYVATNSKHEEEHIKNADDLYAKLPFGAASLEGTLSTAGELSVAMEVVGEYEAERGGFVEADLVGDCADATHVVVALTTGAFTFATGSHAEVAGSVSAGPFGSAGGASANDHSVLSSDGFIDACKKSTPSDKSPVPGCGSLLRLEVVPLPGTAAKVKAEDVAFEEDQKGARTRRTWGYVAAGTGLVIGAGAGIFALLGSQQNRKIQNGGFANAAEIDAAASKGKSYNTLGYVFAGVGAVLVLTGVPLVLSGGEPSRTTVSISPMTTAAGGALTVTFQ